MQTLYHIRTATLSDIFELKALFRQTILTVNRSDYTPEETADWASCGENNDRWAGLITKLYFIVALNKQKQIVGYASLSKDGYLHSMFVHADFQRQGIASLLYHTLEDYAYQHHIRCITSEVSITARPFFEQQGFIVDAVQKQKACRLYLTNHKMSKKLKQLSEMTNEELWQLFPIKLVEYTPEWISHYSTEKEKLEKTIGEEQIVRINHIGSTTVPGLIAKPTIDILLEITDNTDTNRLVKILGDTEYIYSPQPTNPPPHMMFMKGYTVRGFERQVYHLHIRYAGDWDELYFRDYLIAHPETANEYARIKLQLKEKFEHNRDGYTQAKTDFIQSVTTLARKAFKGRYR